MNYIKIYNEENVKNSKADQLFFKLIDKEIAEHRETKETINAAQLCIVDIKGNILSNGNLISICPITRMTILNIGIDSEIPLKTDFMGKLLTIDEEEYARYMQAPSADYLEEKLNLINNLMKKMTDLNKINEESEVKAKH
ncbi:MAG: hypothetical protein Q8936_14210 [Bacillota bacterium]|nr:hypothetical protein [Bacillota bacterium]